MNKLGVKITVLWILSVNLLLNAYEDFYTVFQRENGPLYAQRDARIEYRSVPSVAQTANNQRSGHVNQVAASAENSGEYTDLADLGKIWIRTDTKKYNYGRAYPEFSEGRLFDTINCIILNLPIDALTLKTALAQIAQHADASRDISVKLWPSPSYTWAWPDRPKKDKEYEISFFFLQSLLHRNDSNAHYIQAYLESAYVENLDWLDAVLRFEHNQFIQNRLNQDNAVLSLFKQIYHALASTYIIVSKFSGDDVWIFVFNVYVIVVAGVVPVLYRASWISTFSLMAVVAAVVIVFSHIIDGVNPPHWYQFDILDMLSKGFTTIKYGVGAAAMAFLTGLVYGAINQYRLHVARTLLRERTFSSETTNIPQLGDLVMGYVGGDLN